MVTVMNESEALNHFMNKITPSVTIDCYSDLQKTVDELRLRLSELERRHLLIQEAFDNMCTYYACATEELYKIKELQEKSCKGGQCNCEKSRFKGLQH